MKNSRLCQEFDAALDSWFHTPLPADLVGIQLHTYLGLTSAELSKILKLQQPIDVLLSELWTEDKRSSAPYKRI